MKNGISIENVNSQTYYVDTEYLQLPIVNIIPYDTDIVFDFPVSGIEVINRADNAIQVQDGMDETGFFLGGDNISDCIAGHVVISYGDVCTVTINAGDPDPATTWREQLEPYFGVGNVQVLPPLPVYGWFYLTYIKPVVNAPNPVVEENTLDNGGGPGSVFFVLYSNLDGNTTSFKISVASGLSSGILPVSPNSNNHIHITCPSIGLDYDNGIIVANGKVMLNLFR